MASRALMPAAAAALVALFAAGCGYPEVVLIKRMAAALLNRKCRRPNRRTTSMSSSYAARGHSRSTFERNAAIVSSQVRLRSGICGQGGTNAGGTALHYSSAPGEISDYFGNGSSMRTSR